MSYSQHCDSCCKWMPQSDREQKYCQECQAKIDIRLAAFKNILPIFDGCQSAIVVWPFEKAPKVYQEMSNNGGDEDWVALVPPTILYLPLWLDHLGSDQPQEYEIAEKFRIFIGSHA